MVNVGLCSKKLWASIVELYPVLYDLREENNALIDGRGVEVMRYYENTRILVTRVNDYTVQLTNSDSYELFLELDESSSLDIFDAFIVGVKGRLETVGGYILNVSSGMLSAFCKADFCSRSTVTVNKEEVEVYTLSKSGENTSCGGKFYVYDGHVMCNDAQVYEFLSTNFILRLNGYSPMLEYCFTVLNCPGIYFGLLDLFEEVRSVRG